MARLLIKHASSIVTCDPSDTVYTNSNLLVENGVITYLGPEAQEADEVIQDLKEYDGEVTANWNKRYRENMIRIKSGNVFEVSHVVKSLMMRDHEKGLSTGERKMLNSAKQILVSELVLAKHLVQSEVEQMIEGICMS